MTSPLTIALLVASGRGERMGSKVPKQYLSYQGKSLLRYSIDAFIQHPAIDKIQVMIHPSDLSFYEQAIEGMVSDKLLPPQYGGSERQLSVRYGLEAIAPYNPSYVLIHDGVRPFLSSALIDRIYQGLANASAVVPLLPLAETLKEYTGTHIIKTHPREKFGLAQTPQGFHFPLILHLHHTYADLHATDDAMLCEAENIPITTVPGDPLNRKITYPEDMTPEAPPSFEIRIGSGFDAHRFSTDSQEKNVIYLGGIPIPHPFCLEAHSDGDVVLHALVDALLGTIGAGDIGVHFPPHEARWKNANSSHFLTHAYQLVGEKGGQIINIDLTIIAEAPKILPYRQAMVTKIAQLLCLENERVNIKATTTETMGFTGRREGIAAQAVASVRFLTPKNIAV